MLFQSPEFLFVFLPVALLGFLAARRWAVGLVPFWLIAASMVFYAWWSPAFLALLALSTGINFALGLGMSTGNRRKKVYLLLGLAWNLSLLGYFKYRGFFAENWNACFGTHLPVASLILPLGISFFSFQKIAYLVDVYRGRAAERIFSRYVLFVFFFPQLIAGPIVHPGEILPQMATAWRKDPPLDWDLVRKGLLFFLAGLVKKVLIADNLATHVTPVFDWVQAGGTPTFLDGWCAALGYTFQLYFDFSGYSDMAIGLALLFGIRLPFNFDSPYRAHSIQEFWQRWHMTLSRFIRDYVYIPLGGSRCALPRHYVNILGAMLVSGLWHGAGWHFVLWGGLHGLFLVVNEVWRRSRPEATREALPFWTVPLTFLAVTAAWVLFRADTLAAAGAFYHGMLGGNGLGTLPHRGFPGWLLFAAALAFLAPNTQTWVERSGTARGLPFWERWLPLPSTRLVALLLAIAAFAVLRAIYSQPPSEFIYFNF